MDAEQVKQVARLVPPPTTRPQGGGGNSGASAPPSAAASAESAASAPQDTVSLSTEGRQALKAGVSAGNGGGASTTRELDVTDNNQVILKIKEQSTDRVIKQIPSEDQVALRQAIQKSVQSLDQNI